ncbi:MAG: hypothetical protein K6T92_07135 [Candidatus Rokubacteria bacterium]|nr:hypothetical protein [Candidatus Rokubacteria bacterium]
METRPETVRPDDELVVGDRYYILASSVAADLPRLVLKHDDAFLVADRRGDFPLLPGTEFGFYADGTRFLHQLELRVHGRRPLLLNAAVSDDGLEAAIDLTNPGEWTERYASGNRRILLDESGDDRESTLVLEDDELDRIIGRRRVVGE